MHEYGWVKKDVVIRAYRHMYRPFQRQTDDEIWADIIVVVTHSFHKDRKRYRHLPPLPRFIHKGSRLGTQFLRATYREEILSDVARRSPPLPAESSPESIFRQRVKDELRTGSCVVCHEGFFKENEEPKDNPILTHCCIQLIHFRCLEECMKRGSCPMCRAPQFYCPPQAPQFPRPPYAPAGFALRQAYDYDSDTDSDFSMILERAPMTARCRACDRIGPGRPGTGQYEGNFYCEVCWGEWG